MTLKLFPIKAALALSLTLHLSLGAMLDYPQREWRAGQSQKVKLTIVEKKEVRKVPEPLLPKRTKVPPKPKKPKPKKKPITEREPQSQPQKNQTQVLGLSRTAVIKGGGGPSVPVGNTLMVEDRGVRLLAEDVPTLAKDLSQDARLIRTSIIAPEYTDDAIEAGIEGVFIVDVFVDDQGAVVEVELAKPIGFGMDKSVIAVAKRARFHPRRDKAGKSLSGWTIIKFSLEIE